MSAPPELFDQAFALHQQGRFEEALEGYQQLLRHDPTDFDALHLSGVIALQQGRLADAADLVGRAVERHPGNATAQSNLGIVRQQLHDLEQALLCFERAIRLRPNYAAAHFNRGNVFASLRRPQEAVSCYDAAIALDPAMIDAHNNRGLALKDLGRLDEAVQSFDRALALQPNHAAAHNNRGNALWHSGRQLEALQSFDAALALQPDMPMLRGDRLRKRLQLAEWGNLSVELSDLARRAAQGEAVAPPFAMLGLLDSPPLHRRVAEAYARGRWPGEARWSEPGTSAAGRDGRIHIGYFSADFHSHATAFLMAGLFERHDRARFKVTAYSFGPTVEDAMRQRLRSAFDQFVEVGGLSDREVAALSRSHGIDIAVDLKGYTELSRPGIFACRAAPVQVNYLGYPGTMAVDFMDYLIADPIVIPERSRVHFSEKIAYLPHSYQVNDDRREVADRVFSRAELGLPQEGVVFCCFNNGYKILPDTFDAWMRVLTAVDGSVLWLFHSNEHGASKLRLAAKARGVDPSRLRFAQFMPQAGHLARLRAADLFLDTAPYNAHTTASDALWAGVPVITWLGESFAARVAGSLLHAVGLPEMVCATQKDMETLAIDLAQTPGRLASVRSRLADGRKASPLFDTAAFTRHLEALYEAMVQRARDGLAPEHLG